MLSQPFISWWFAPWTYMAAPIKLAGVIIHDPLALRDGYRQWCGQYQLLADLPPHLEPGWEIAALSDRSILLVASRLFGGILAAREQNQSLLNGLPFAERKWCISIAATQPLRRCVSAGRSSPETLELLGLSEIAARLEHDFSGMWSRLRLQLAPTLAQQVDSTLSALAKDDKNFDTQSARAQRCWRLCRTYAENNPQIANAASSAKLNSNRQHRSASAPSKPAADGAGRTLN